MMMWLTCLGGYNCNTFGWLVFLNCADIHGSKDIIIDNKNSYITKLMNTWFALFNLLVSQTL